MLTVALLNYNGNDTLLNSINSVLIQTYKPDRFVVIDNHSTDDSRKIASKQGIEIIDTDNKHKLITGLNTALSLRKNPNDRIFFMQNDVVLSARCLEKLLEVTKYRRDFIAQPSIYDSYGEIDNVGMDYKWPGYGERRSKKWWRDGEVWADCGMVTTICFLLHSYDKSFGKHNGNGRLFFDELFSPAYYEDVDFYLRTKNFLSHILIPDAKAFHLGNHSFSQTMTKKQISNLCHKHRMKIIKKHYHGIDRLIRSAVAACFYIMKKTFDIIRFRGI